MESHRIAFLLPRWSGGGAESISATLATALSARYGHHVELWATRFDEERRRALEAAGHVTASPRDIAGRLRHRDGATVDAVATLTARRDIDVLVVAVSPLNDMGRLHKLIGDRCSIIFHLHGQPFWELLPFTAPAPLTARRAVEFLRRDLKQLLFKTYSRRATRLYRQAYDYSDACVVLCEAYRRDLERRLAINHADSRVRAIYNPFRPAGCDIGKKEREVLYVGRLDRADKRVDRLLRIWSSVADEHPDWQLHIVGEGRDRRALERMAAHMPRVSFHGYQNPRPFYRRASVVALTSTFEGWPGVLIEALDNGCVPIAFACSDGVTEILSEGRGTAVTPYDETEYARLLSRLLDDYPLCPTRPDDWLARLDEPTAAAAWHRLITELRTDLSDTAKYV